MAKYHIGRNGPSVCRALNGKCPYGGATGSENHFETEQEAQKSYEKSMAHLTYAESGAEVSAKQSKALNGTVGHAFEACIADALNGVQEAEFAPSISDMEPILRSEADSVASELRNRFGDGITGVVIGDKVTKERGDLLLSNGLKYEIKRTSGGNGTYHNTSVRALERSGVEPMNSFYEKVGYYSKLEQILENAGSDIRPDRTSPSPFSKKEADVIRKQMKPAYKEIQAAEAEARRRYVAECVMPKLTEDKSALTQLVSDMEHKKTSLSDSVKDVPDGYLVYNYKKGTTVIESKDDIAKIFEEPEGGHTVENVGSSIKINGRIRVVFGWQNGTGLNNPTLRVFI